MFYCCLFIVVKFTVPLIQILRVWMLMNFWLFELIKFIIPSVAVCHSHTIVAFLINNKEKLIAIFLNNNDYCNGLTRHTNDTYAYLLTFFSFFLFLSVFRSFVLFSFLTLVFFFSFLFLLSFFTKLLHKIGRL